MYLGFDVSNHSLFLESNREFVTFFYGLKLKASLYDE
ncbi:hypothetical protein CKC_04455 [Candidatus Liberibacter solanacearum CLso-ZC1]|uniref:Uncharacterized protein n=1 Tax=Liberibacter solanacearum (strain CLso-ZC1) TaxID=658172 RepID=E4UDG2_LIBSC|nr:hypothetical protein CKC_04455 [Candidatus Liberibacter solanacearum CLso-ZC1]